MTVVTATMMFHHFGHFLSLLALTIQFIRLIVRVLSPYVQYCRPTVLLFLCKGKNIISEGERRGKYGFRTEANSSNVFLPSMSRFQGKKGKMLTKKALEVITYKGF